MLDIISEIRLLNTAFLIAASEFRRSEKWLPESSELRDGTSANYLLDLRTSVAGFGNVILNSQSAENHVCRGSTLMSMRTLMISLCSPFSKYGFEYSKGHPPEMDLER